MPTDTHIHLGILFIGLITGGGGIRFLVYVSKAMPPISDKAGWWAHLFYNMLKNTSGVDPSSVIMSQHTLKELAGGNFPEAK